MVTSTELLDLLPDFVVMVTANSLTYIEVLREIIKVDRPVISQQEICKLKGILNFCLIIRFDVCF